MDTLQRSATIPTWRTRFFTLNTPLLLNPTQRYVLFKYVNNLWRYKHRSPRGRVYVCRAAHKSRRVDKTSSSYPIPLERQRNRPIHERVPCPASMLEVELADGNYYYERRGKAHSHDLGTADSRAACVPLRRLEKTRKKRVMVKEQREGRGNKEEEWDRMAWSSGDGRCRVGLTYEGIDVAGMYAGCKSGKAGAVVVFSGCTRDNSVPEGAFVERGGEKGMGNAYAIEGGQHEQAGGGGGHNGTTQQQASSAPSHPASLPVASLTYTSYVPLAMKTLQAIAEQIHSTYHLERIAITHRLGTVPVGEESVVICVSAGHRQEVWRAGEWALEEVKKRVEIWKWEVFGNAGDGEPGDAVWRSNVTDNRLRAEREQQEGEQSGETEEDADGDDNSSEEESANEEQQQSTETAQVGSEVPQ